MKIGRRLEIPAATMKDEAVEGKSTNEIDGTEPFEDRHEILSLTMQDGMEEIDNSWFVERLPFLFGCKGFVDQLFFNRI